MRALAIAFLVGGCAADLSDAGFVDGLRLLGVNAEPPEVDVNHPTKLTAWVVDTKARGITVDWSWCTLPSNGLADSGCITRDDALVPLGTGGTLDIVVPNVDRRALGPPDATDGVYLPIVLRVTVAGDRVDAVYRLRIAGDQPANQNPKLNSIQGISPEGTATPTYQGQIWSLLAVYANPEKYFIPSRNETVTETLTTQWFATAGTLAADFAGTTPVSGNNAYETFKLDKRLPSRGAIIDLWAVGHDERGGTTLGHRTLVLE